MHNFQNKRYYISTNINSQRPFNLRKNKKTFLHLNSLNNQNDNLPLLNTSKMESVGKVKKLIFKKTKKSSFFNNQLKLMKIIIQEAKMKKESLNLIKNKLKDDNDEFNNFLIKSNEINDYIFNEDNRKRRNVQYKLNLKREEKKVFSSYRQIGKNVLNDDDYQKRFKLLFPGEQINDPDYFNKKVKDVITIQRLFRKSRIKKKLYIGFEEPYYVIRIYEHEYDIYPNIKSIEIIIYSTLFKTNVTFIKTIEELFGVESMKREKIQKKIEQIIDGIICSKSSGSRRENDDYYNPDKADLSSDDFNDFEDDDD